MYTVGEYIRLKEMEANARKVKESQPISQTRKVYNETKIKLPLHEDKSIKAA